MADNQTCANAPIDRTLCRGHTNHELENMYQLLRQRDRNIINILTPILVSLCLLGIVGNILTIIIFSRFRKNTSAYFVLTLAVIDLTICVLIIPGQIALIWHRPFYLSIFCKVFELVRNASVPLSTLMLVVIAVDRLFLISLSTHGIITGKRAKALIVLTILISIPLGIPPMLATGVYWQDAHGICHYRGICIPDFTQITQGQMKKFWIFMTAMFSIISTLLIIVYLLIFIMVYHQSRRWNRNKIIPDKKLSCLSKDVNDKSASKFLQEPRKIFVRSVSDTAVNNISDPRHSRDNTATQPKPTFITRHESLKLKNIHKNNEKNLFIIKVTPAPNTNSGDEISVIDNNSIDNPSIQQHSAMGNHVKHASSFTQESSTSASGSQGFQGHESSKSSTRQRIHFKMAQVLFTVTIVFIISFLPIFLMSHQLIPYIKVLYYMYYINNAANPVIYCFMNKRFRREIKRLICKSRQM